MLGIYFKITNITDNSKKANYSNAVHNYLFESLDAIKLDKKTRFFIVKKSFNLRNIRKKIKNITDNNADIFIFEIGDYVGWMNNSFWRKIE
ncbi:hypothetical protein [Mycoplasma todarodis]|uniref:Uncharacterized protein n=1 Tax=Mycoplasma todarodis TaxID=1937191 RepID=A0A4R0XT80_9MOLU|nr:hypothetical protein [Mycoplasma todarodis]TCG12103.1 hypothetical protein C4B25_00210 [Mycoplasma todarodis]